MLAGALTIMMEVYHFSFFAQFLEAYGGAVCQTKLQLLPLIFFPIKH